MTLGKEIVCGTPPLPSSVERVLPKSIREEVWAKATATVEELRLKSGRRSWMLCNGKNIILDAVLDRASIETILMNVCGGSLYAHAEHIREGFITLSGGIRVGVAGCAAVENGKLVGVRDISSLCFRIPTDIRVDVSSLEALVRGSGGVRGLLLYSPPGGGKTTALRCLARTLSSGEKPMRVVIVDTRGELSAGLSGRGLCLDILSGYPRREGIEIAARSMGAEIVICDEICGEDEARIIMETGAGGVPLLASAHAADLEGLLSRSDMKCLHRAGVFCAYVRVDRHCTSPFDIVARGDAETVL